ncbi:MAG: hypothetical protein AAF840_07495 [Bacteroidota bacterium]
MSTEQAIRRYLQQRMSAAERLEFEAQLAQDPALQTQFERFVVAERLAAEEALTEIRGNAEKLFAEDLQPSAASAAPHTTSPPHLYYGLVVLLLAALAGLWWYLRPSETNDPAKQEQEQVRPIAQDSVAQHIQDQYLAYDHAESYLLQPFATMSGDNNLGSNLVNLLQQEAFEPSLALLGQQGSEAPYPERRALLVAYCQMKLGNYAAAREQLLQLKTQLSDFPELSAETDWLMALNEIMATQTITPALRTIAQDNTHLHHAAAKQLIVALGSTTE